MLRKPPLKTYERKNNGKLNFSTNQKPTHNFNAVEKEETKKKELLDDSLYDPFDTTFDRLLKYANSQPSPPPLNPGLSYINSSLEDSGSPTSPKMLNPDTEEDFIRPSSNKKPRIKTQGSKPVKSKEKTSKPSKLVKEEAKVDKNEKIKVKKKSTKRNRKKTDEEKLMRPVKRRRRRISSSSENTSTDLVIVKRKTISESSSPDDPSVNSNSYLAGFSISHTPLIIKSSPDIANEDELHKVENVQKLVSNPEKLDGTSNEFSPKKSSQSEKSPRSKEDFHSSVADSVISSKIVSYESLKACSIVLKRCDSMLKKKEVPFKLKYSSVKIPRHNAKSKMKVKASIIQVLENKSEKEKEVTKKVPIEETNSIKFSRRLLIPEKSQLNENLALKDCVVNLTRIKPAKNSFSGKLVSSTPFVKSKNRNFMLGEVSPMTLEISNIVASSQTLRPEIESITSRKASEPSLQLEDINSNNNNQKNNITPKHLEYNSEMFNVSSDYSEIDWTTVSLSDSQCMNPPFIREQQKSLVAANKTSNDLSSASKGLEPISMQFDFVTKRNLNLLPEYEKSTSMFDDTKISESEYMPIKLTPLKIDEKSVRILPTMSVLTKMISPKDKSAIDSSILQQSEFRGFEDKTSPEMKKLSPMTEILTSIIHSLSHENSDKSLILESEEDKRIHSLALEKKFPSGKSPRKCLKFEKEPKICLGDDSVSLNKEPFDKESFNKKSINNESFDQESIKDSRTFGKESFNKESIKDSTYESFNLDSCSQNSCKDFLSKDSSFKDSFSQESLTQQSSASDSEKELGIKLELDDSSSCSSKKLEISQSSLRTLSILSEDEYSQKKEENLNTLDGKVEAKEGQILETQAMNTSENKIRESIGSLNRLKDPIRITHQRKKYKNWGLQLSAITENESKRFSENEVEISPRVEEEKVDPIPEISSSLCDTVSPTNDGSLNNGKNAEVPEPHLFLKPGKSWARSLSILNNIHSRDDVDRLSVGKGKKWRHSVLNILDMQSKGIIQSCFRQQDEPKTPQKCGGALNGNSDYESRVERLSTVGSISPNRFVKRISIRVVPADVKKRDGIEDTQFLEAYGISSSQPTKTLSQRFLSLENNHSFIGLQETLVYNVQLEDSVIKTIDTPPLVTAKDVVLERCRQDDYLPFDECYPEKFLQHCRKIGEGVYGEVFLYVNGSDNSVIKIIPIEGEINVNGEPQKKFHEILSEIVIAKELHDLRFGEKYNTAGFVEVKNIKCIIGRYPSKLIELWQSYDDEKKSENDCPSMFDENQLYISLELGHGGQDLEAFVFQNASESYAVFIQTAFALAVAEQGLEFEHRDLHWGNVLISRSRKSQVSYKFDDKEINFPSSGVKVAIIDFTLSRMSYQGCCIFNDLALDPALFTAEGEYQFDVYRLMRERIENNWQKFEPYTNVLWLHYTLDKMIKLVRYKKKTTKIHKAAIEQLMELKDEVLNYESAFDLVTKCDKFTSLYGNMNTQAPSSF